MHPVRRWLIGSSPDCDVVVDAATVSGRHCALAATEGGIVLEDLDSTNGTFVNGHRVSTPVYVRETDQIILGRNVPLPWPAALKAPLPARATPGSGAGQPQIVTIGYEADNDIVLGYPMISAHHARLLVSGQELLLEDLSSTNGTAVNSPRNRIVRVRLNPEDTVYFGSFRIPARRLIEGRLNLGESAHAALHFGGRQMVLGRDPGCDVVLDYPTISNRHAKLTKGDDGRVFVEDLRSLNGTFVNGRRVSESTVVKVGDSIGLGSYTLELTSAGTFKKRDYHGNLAIEAVQLTIDVPGRRLLEDVSVVIYPSEFVGLMGPSGAGKTTLMNSLNGYTPPTGGRVLFNGSDLYANYGQFSNLMGYVPQDDIIHRQLTVGQALYYTARLRLPPDMSDKDVKQRIDKVLAELGLQGTENVIVGSPERKGISGGQRKRVNLAMELLTDPAVLFLDEPTSGLSSEDTLMVMKVLRQLADSGKTILLTIHQPSLEAYRLMDNLLLVAKDQGSPNPGRLVYYGPAYPDAVEFFNPEGVPGAGKTAEPSPDEILRGLGKRPSNEWNARYEGSAYKREYVSDRLGKRPANAGAAFARTSGGSFALLQLWTLVRRCIAIKISDRWNTAILLAQAPIVGLLIAVVFRKQLTREISLESWPNVAGSSAVAVFLMGLSSLWFGCSNAAREIVGEWAIYHRERMVNLKIPAYVASKLAVLGLLSVVQCLILVSLVHWGCDMKAHGLAMLAVLVLISFVGLAIGLVISSLVRTSEAAVALLPIILIPMVVLGGAMVRVEQMPDLVQPLTYAIPTRWGFEATMLLEAENREREPSLLSMPGASPRNDKAAKRRDMAHFHFPDSIRVGVLPSVLALCVMGGSLVIAVHLILRARDVH